MKSNSELATGRTATENFQAKLDSIILPLVEQAIDFASKPVTREVLTAQFYEVLAVAVLGGVKLSEKTDEIINKEIDHKLNEVNTPEKTEIERNMERHEKGKDAAARLNVGNKEVMADGLPRFVLPEELDKDGNFRK